MPDKIKEKLAAMLQNDKTRVNCLICFGVVGMLLLAVSAWLPEPADSSAAKAQKTAQDESDYGQQYEARLEALISQLDGAGQTEVMLTLATGEENIYALDTEISGEQRSQTHVLINNSDTAALVETVNAPVVEGVAVLCEGGDKVRIQAAITEMVHVLTGVGTNKITVGKLAQQAK